MFENTNKRFLTFKANNGEKTSDVKSYILVDRETGVQYICILGGHGSLGCGITPLLNANGEILKCDDFPI